jgi:hypothetical protein
MPTEREREYYRMGFIDAMKDAKRDIGRDFGDSTTRKRGGKRTRKLSKWQQFVKKNAKFPRFKYKSGRKKGMINLKALGVAYRKKKR